MVEEKIAVATIGKDAYRTEVKARKHSLIVDEPEAVGGKDLGPKPGDLMRMSLASCTAITLSMYSNRKNFDIEQIEVTVSSEEKEGKTIFHSGLTIKGNLQEAQYERLMQIAKLCPVHKMLTNPIEVITSWRI